MAKKDTRNYGKIDSYEYGGPITDDEGLSERRRQFGTNRLRTEMNYDKNHGNRWATAAGEDAKNVDRLVRRGPRTSNVDDDGDGGATE